VLDARKLQAMTPWGVSVPLEEGLRRTVTYFTERFTGRKTT
jgi:dTDP-D-glucose 4,6-dehydratase